ncbi:MAG: ABC transporter substrate-binding protein [Alphaproteobacteria bacterium]|nr:ABC transporter substrate-binding protein [Alphaproteobacteria bacterium]
MRKASSPTPIAIFRLSLAIWLAAVALAPWPSMAEDLAVRTGARFDTLDPHQMNSAPNAMIGLHLFEPLVTRASGLPAPGLALSWRPIDETAWEFKLRPDVVFHDGSPFTADDVIATMNRILSKPRGESLGFRQQIEGMVELTAPDPLTLVIRTSRPDPAMPGRLFAINIIPRHLAAATSAEFNSGEAAVGTGPFKLVSWKPGEFVEFAAFDRHWAGLPRWDKVTISVEHDNAQRVAALSIGRVRLIDQVPPADIDRLARNPALGVFNAVSTRVLVLHPDHSRDRTPFVSDLDGRPLTSNPLKDVRVRRAISKAIDRTDIVLGLFSGRALPAGQLLSAGFGVDPKIEVDRFDPAEAKALLDAAGWGDGFRLTLHCPSDRYVNDEQVCGTLARMLGRVGIRVAVEALPSAEFFPRLALHEFSLAFFGWGAIAGDVSDTLLNLLAGPNCRQGWGAANAGRYSNREFDETLDRAMASFDEKRREALLRAAVGIAMDDMAVIPLYYPMNHWAARRPVAYPARADDLTLAADAYLSP